MRKNKIILLFLVTLIALSLCGGVLAKTLRERDQEARAKYQAAKEQYLKEVNWWRTTRQQFITARTKYRQFKNAENKAEYEEKARAFLEKTVEVLIRKLEALKTWISNKPALSEETRAKIVAEIEKDINWLQEKKSGIATASPTQIKEKAKEIRHYWRKHRLFVKRIIGEIWAARLDWAIERFETVAEKIAAKIDELKAMGKDTSKLEAWLADFNEKIELAKEKRDQAREKYQAIKGEPGPDFLRELAEANQFFRQVHQFIKKAHQYLIEAHKTLVEIVKEMKTLATATGE